MNFAEIKYFDVANGPGVRTSLFVSGCTHHCKNCFNQATWDFNYGRPFTIKEEDEIIKSLQPDYIRGFTLLGGEPFELVNQKGVLPLLKRIRRELPGKDIWCFTGYLYDSEIRDVMAKKWSETREMLECIDVLVDGRFIEEKKNLMLRFKGSENQRTINVPESLKEGGVILMEGY